MLFFTVLELHVFSFSVDPDSIEAVEHSVIDGGSSSLILLMMLVSLLPYLLDGCSSSAVLLCRNY